MLANFMIGLREGLEAALVIGILIAYLRKQDRLADVRRVAVGVIAAILTSVASGLTLTLVVADAEEGANQLIGGFASLLAVIFVTWMIFWMAKHSRALPSELHNKLASATGTITVVAIGFFSVVREGIETSIFLWSSSEVAGKGALTLWGAVLGLLVAALLGYAIYRGSLRLNLRVFFAVTSSFLILVAAGILAYAVKEFEELGWFPFLQDQFYNFEAITPEGSWSELLLKGTVGYNPAPSILQAIVWAAYFVPVSYIFWMRTRKK